ncbi:MAG: hypothetical protein WC971_08945 [Coriobacteriia bacterium]
MRIAVVQHRLRDGIEADRLALADVVDEAARAGAKVVIVPALSGSSACDETSAKVVDGLTVVSVGDGAEPPFDTPLGRTAVLWGDACAEAGVLARLAREGVSAMAWRPEPESAIQAEAFRELAIGVSLAVAGLVLVTAVVDGSPERPGCAAIVVAGDVVAEAGDSEEVLFADVEVPVALGVRERQPEVPPILRQRLAVHGGTRSAQPWPTDATW